MNAEEQKQQEPKSNIISMWSSIKKYSVLLSYIALIAIILYSGIYIRTLNKSGTVDVTTGKMTLSPDLDPFLYLRWAREIVANGSIPKMDMMRYSPIGFDTSWELTMPVHMIVWLYQFLNVFGTFSVEYAADLLPVIFFCMFLVAFFMFVKKAFSDFKGSEWMAAIATLIVSLIPGLLHRTLWGVPEKEAPGLFFMFLALYFFVSLLKSDTKMKAAYMEGAAAGIATGFMGLVWGGVTFLFMSIPFAVALMFFFSKIEWKDVIGYACWCAGFTILLLTMTTRYGTGIISPMVAGLAYLMLIVLIMGKIFDKRWKALGSAAMLVLLTIIILRPQFGGKSFWAYITTDVLNYVMKPFITDRLTLTVAENQIVYFSAWLSSFGPYLFWFFLLGFMFLAFEAFGKDKKAASFASIAFVMSLIFSRYSATSNSNMLFIVGILIFIGGLISSLLSEYRKEEQSYSDKSLILMLAVVIFAVFCCRSAVRLFYFIYPFVPIMIGFLFIRLFSFTKSQDKEGKEDGKEDTKKYMAWIIIAMMIILVPMTLNNFHQGIVYEAKSTVTGQYEAQWQNAMEWVRNNTPQGSVFAHWWDYGYWVQTIGQRSTILDGGNFVAYWDHLMGGLVLTGNAYNMTEGMSFLKTHNAKYLLIDSTDIGKYSAYSSIGSGADYDKLSSLQVFTMDKSSTQEKRNSTVYLYRGYAALEDSFVWDGKVFPAGQAVVVGFFVPVSSFDSSIMQPAIIVIYNNAQTVIPVSCVYAGGKRYDFNSSDSANFEGINGCIYLMPMLGQTEINSIGAGLWLSPRLMKSEMVHLYILDEEQLGFYKVHYENNSIIQSINQQYNLGLPDILYHYQAGILGPIKIWKINYAAYPNAIENPQYLNRTFPSKDLWAVNS